MALKAKHAFGNSSSVESAKQANKIDAFDILFLDGSTDPKVGWIDKDGNTVICQNKKQIVRVAELPTSAGDENVVYLFENKGYVWDIEQQKCIPMAESADVTELTDKIATLEGQVAGKADTDTVNAQIKATLGEHLSKIGSYKVSDAPDGTLVNYLDKEVRIMIPADHQWELRPSGEGADQETYYIGFKAYAPENAISFKEDLKKVIEDETMFYFEGNDFAGTEDDGRKFSIIWLPVAAHDSSSDTWTYYGAGSSEEKYIGWFYSVEWYDIDGDIIASDCVRINLANESCFGMPTPYYINDAVKTVKAYTDEQIEAKITEMSSVEVIEF